MSFLESTNKVTDSVNNVSIRVILSDAINFLYWLVMWHVMFSGIQLSHDFLYYSISYSGSVNTFYNVFSIAKVMLQSINYSLTSTSSDDDSRDNLTYPQISHGLITDQLTTSSFFLHLICRILMPPILHSCILTLARWTCRSSMIAAS